MDIEGSFFSLGQLEYMTETRAMQEGKNILNSIQIGIRELMAFEIFELYNKVLKCFFHLQMKVVSLMVTKMMI